MSYKAILSQRKPTKEALQSYYDRKCRDIDFEVRRYYEKLKNTRIDEEKKKIDKKMIRKLASRIKSETIKYKSAVKSLKNGTIEIKTKPQSVASVREKAYSRFQKRRRLSLADKDGMIWTMDTKKYMKRNQKGIVSGHYFSKHNHPNLGFEPLNVRPIQNQTNRMQGDQPGYYRRDNLVEKIGREMFEQLEALAKQNDLIIRDRTYREEQEDLRKIKYQLLVEERTRKGWIV